MNTVRMVAFAAAALITALLFRVLADGFTFEEPSHTAIAAHGAATSGGPQSAAAGSSR